MIAPVFLYSGFVPNGATALVTTPVNATYLVRNATFTNVTAGSVLLTINLVPSGGVASSANRVLSAYSLGGGLSYTPEGLMNQVMETGATLVCAASVASAISATISGLSA